MNVEIAVAVNVLQLSDFLLHLNFKTLPALQNSRSDETDVALIAKYFLASLFWSELFDWLQNLIRQFRYLSAKYKYWKYILTLNIDAKYRYLNWKLSMFKNTDIISLITSTNIWTILRTAFLDPIAIEVSVFQDEIPLIVRPETRNRSYQLFLFISVSEDIGIISQWNIESCQKFPFSSCFISRVISPARMDSCIFHDALLICSHLTNTQNCREAHDAFYCFAQQS